MNYSPSIADRTEGIYLSSSLIIDLLGDPEFYPRCVAYFFLREQALAAVQQWKQLVSREPAEREGQPNEQACLQPSLQGFVRITLQLFRQHPDLLLPLRDYLREKLNPSANRVWMRCMFEGKRLVISF